MVGVRHQNLSQNQLRSPRRRPNRYAASVPELQKWSCRLSIQAALQPPPPNSVHSLHLRAVYNNPHPASQMFYVFNFFPLCQTVLRAACHAHHPLWLESVVAGNMSLNRHFFFFRLYFPSNIKKKKITSQNILNIYFIKYIIPVY